MVGAFKFIVLHIKLFVEAKLTEGFLPGELGTYLFREVCVLAKDGLVTILESVTVVSDIEYIIHAECDTPSLMWRYVGEDIIRKERMPSVHIVLDILFVSKSLHVQHPLNMLPNLIRVPEPHLIRQAPK